jgi:hypothetical protein
MTVEDDSATEEPTLYSISVDLVSSDKSKSWNRYPRTCCRGVADDNGLYVWTWEILPARAAALPTLPNLPRNVLFIPGRHSPLQRLRSNLPSAAPPCGQRSPREYQSASLVASSVRPALRRPILGRSTVAATILRLANSSCFAVMLVSLGVRTAAQAQGGWTLK